MEEEERVAENKRKEKVVGVESNSMIEKCRWWGYGASPTRWSIN